MIGLTTHPIDLYANYIEFFKLKDAVSNHHIKITGSVNQRMELEEKRGDASLEELFGYNDVQAKDRAPAGTPIPKDRFVIPDLEQRGNLFKLEGSAVGDSILIEDGGTDGSGTNAGDEILLDRTATPNVDAGDGSHTGTRVGLTDFVRFSEGRDIEVVQIPDDPLSVLDRAKEMLHRNDYHLLTRNCEHYANYALSGTWDSEQSNLTLSKVAEGIGMIVASLFGGKRI